MAAVQIERGMGFDKWREAWFALARERGHTLRVHEDMDGAVDQFVTDGGYHNGPGCTKCGWTECMHCDWDGKRIPVCSGPKK